MYRISGNSGIGFAQDEMRVLLLETLRHEGFRTAGVESLVFARDDSAKADYALGGTVREAVCKREGKLQDCCRVGIDWELLDVVRDQVVYRHLSRYGECHLSGLDAKASARRLVIGSFRRLLHRARFTSELRDRAALQAEKPYPPAKVARCKRRKLAMSRASDTALDAAVIVRAGKGHGSGFFLNSEGFVLTAAHVLQSNEVMVKTREGVSYRARPLRVSRKFDVALLKAELPDALPDQRCLPLRSGGTTGDEVYVMGAPASEELGFSLTRGIVSGRREQRGVHYLQTDAPVSPGNSGGALVDANGRALAVVVSKLAGVAYEGIAFGVPVDVGLRALGLAEHESSDSDLRTAAALALTSARQEAFVDPADPIPQPVRDHGRVMNPHTFVGANVRKRRDSARDADVVQGWFYVGPNLELIMIGSPALAPDRVAFRLENKWGSLLKECSGLELVINSRPYRPLQSAVKNAVRGGPLHASQILRIESQFDLSTLRRMREHAPTLTVRACDKRWTLAPTQLRAVLQWLDTYDALADPAQHAMPKP